MNFMLFYGSTYYPNGGMNDFKGHFESKEACLSYLKEDEDREFISWGHIFNAHSGVMHYMDIEFDEDTIVEIKLREEA